MKIKHFQGYGNVSAVRVHRTDDKAIVRVSGLHECGLAIMQGDKYRLASWLGKIGKFTEDQIASFSMQEYWDSGNKIDVCTYTVLLKSS